MEIQNHSASVPPSEENPVIPYSQNILIPQLNINNQPPDDEESGYISRNRISFSSFRIPNLREELQTHYSTEKLLAVTFIWIMRSATVCCAVYGFAMLEKSNSISPIAWSLFKYSLGFFIGVSVSYANIEHHTFNAATCGKRRYFGLHLALPLAQIFSPIGKRYIRMVFYANDIIYIACMGGFNGHGKFVKFVLYWVLQIIMLPMELGDNMPPGLVLVIIILISFRAVRSDIELFAAYVSKLVRFLDKSIQKLLPVAAARINSKLRERKKKIGKFINYAITLFATILFQNFFRLTKFSDVKAFIHLAISWLASLALINASQDFGILNFLLGNMVLGSTVGQSGIGMITWLTYGICLYLYVLGVKLKVMAIKISNSESMENWPKPPFLFWILYCCALVDSIYKLIQYLK